MCTARQPSPEAHLFFLLLVRLLFQVLCGGWSSSGRGLTGGLTYWGEEGQASKKALFRINPQGSLWYRSKKWH